MHCRKQVKKKTLKTSTHIKEKEILNSLFTFFLLNFNARFSILENAFYLFHLIISRYIFQHFSFLNFCLSVLIRFFGKSAPPKTPFVDKSLTILILQQSIPLLRYFYSERIIKTLIKKFRLSNYNIIRVH